VRSASHGTERDGFKTILAEVQESLNSHFSTASDSTKLEQAKHRWCSSISQFAVKCAVRPLSIQVDPVFTFRGQELMFTTFFCPPADLWGGGEVKSMQHDVEINTQVCFYM